MRFTGRVLALLFVLQFLPAGASAQEQPTGLFILEHELKKICSGNDWIPSDSTCRALDSLLAPALKFRRENQGVLLEKERAFLREELTKFIAALEAGRCTTIKQNAFTILHVLARRLRESVTDSPEKPTEVFGFCDPN
jgi:hypothetical protein